MSYKSKYANFELEVNNTTEGAATETEQAAWSEVKYNTEKEFDESILSFDNDEKTSLIDKANYYRLLSLQYKDPVKRNEARQKAIRFLYQADRQYEMKRYGELQDPTVIYSVYQRLHTKSVSEVSHYEKHKNRFVLAVLIFSLILGLVLCMIAGLRLGYFY